MASDVAGAIKTAVGGAVKVVAESNEGRGYLALGPISAFIEC